MSIFLSRFFSILSVSLSLSLFCCPFVTHSLCLFVFLYICISVCLSVSIYVCMYVCLYAYTCTMYLCMYVYIPTTLLPRFFYSYWREKIRERETKLSIRSFTAPIDRLGQYLNSTCSHHSQFTLSSLQFSSLQTVHFISLQLPSVQLS